MASSPRRIGIVGASARAAAESARRAGFEPWCADLFADRDLTAWAEAVRCPAARYPAGLRDLLERSPDAPWFYTGGLENHPDLVAEMAEIRPLWGVVGEPLRRARSPEFVSRLLTDAGLPSPKILPVGPAPPGRWLVKPLRGAAGAGIAFAGDATPGPSTYLQEFIVGLPMSATFVRTATETVLLGIAEQWIGEPQLNAGPFRYAGNIGPIEPSAELRRDLRHVGVTVADGCGLRGWFGIDFILRAGRPWLVEVNPRYVASMEVLERGLRIAALAFHRQAFELEGLGTPTPGPANRVWAKGVLYADRPLTVPAGLWEEFGTAIADVPHPGNEIEAGWPILTVLADGPDRAACEAEFWGRVEAVKRLVFP